MDILPMAENDHNGLAQLYQARYGPAEVAAKDRVCAILCKEFFSGYRSAIAAGHEEHPDGD